MTIPSNVRTLIGPWQVTSGASPVASLPPKSPTLHGFGAFAPSGAPPTQAVQPRLPSKHPTLVGLYASPNVYVEPMNFHAPYGGAATAEDSTSFAAVPITRVSPLAIVAAVFAGFVFLGALIATVACNLTLG